MPATDSIAVPAQGYALRAASLTGSCSASARMVRTTPSQYSGHHAMQHSAGVTQRTIPAQKATIQAAPLEAPLKISASAVAYPHPEKVTTALPQNDWRNYAYTAPNFCHGYGLSHSGLERPCCHTRCVNITPDRQIFARTPYCLHTIALHPAASIEGSLGVLQIVVQGAPSSSADCLVLPCRLGPAMQRRSSASTRDLQGRMPISAPPQSKAHTAPPFSPCRICPTKFSISARGAIIYICVLLERHASSIALV